MSDLFIGEILVLLLLVPVLLRPFSRRLQRIAGIPLLPLIAFVFCLLICAGSGLKVSFFPILLVSFIVFVFGLIRLVRLFMGLPTDWYKPLSVAWNAFLLAAFVFVVFLSFMFAPESGYLASSPVSRATERVRETGGLSARYTVWNASLASGPAGAQKPVLIMLGDIGTGARGRSTAAIEIAEAGFTVLAAEFSGPREYRNPLMGSPSYRQFATVSARILTASFLPADGEEIRVNQENELSLLVRHARSRYGSSVPLYALAEGSGASALFSYSRNYPGAFTGSIAIVNSAAGIPLPPVSGADALPAGYAVLEGLDGMMPASAGSFPVLVITGSDWGRYGLGELAGDDVLAARLLGSTRDVGRKSAALAGARVVSWLSDRRVHDRP